MSLLKVAYFAACVSCFAMLVHCSVELVALNNRDLVPPAVLTGMWAAVAVMAVGLLTVLL